MQRIVSNLRRAVQLVWRSSPRWTALSLGLLVIQGGLPVLSLYLLKQLIDAVTAGITSPQPLVALQPVLLWIGLAGAVALLNDGCQALANLAQTAQTEQVTDYVHEQLHAKSIAVDLDYYENADYYNTLHRSQQEASYRPTMILRNLTQAVQSGVSLLGVSLLLLALHWSLVVLLALAIVPGLLMRLQYTGKLYQRQWLWTGKERQAYYFHTLLTERSPAKEMRLFNLGAFFSQWFQQLRRDIRQEKLRLATRQSAIDLVTQASATLAVFITCGVIAFQTLQGAITLGGFVMYYQAFQRAQTFLREVLSNLVSLYENSLFLIEFYRFLDLPAIVATPAQPVPVPHPWCQGLEFHQVSFRYPHSGRSVLKSVSFKLNPGETIALVGENGAGKTTLIKLLCRLYDPTEGFITLDGVDLRQFCPIALRRQISVLFQDYLQYQLSAQDNIWLGNIDLPSDHPQVLAAAQQADADALIRQLPQGYQTHLGKQLEQGEDLSLGQWQKIALARGFMRDAALMILDEPTSALDARSEAEVLEKFRHLVRDKMAILISHRLSTVKLADRILVLAGGTLAECGTHDELMQQQGIYAKLYETQAQNYRW